MDQAAQVNLPENVDIGPIAEIGGTYNVVALYNGDLSDAIVYHGPSTDVYNQGGSSNEMMICLEDGKYADPVDSVFGTQIPAGGTTTISLSNLTSLSEEIAVEDLDISVTGRGTASSVRYAIVKVWYDEPAGDWKVQVSEIEGATSITVDVEVHR